MTKVSAVLLNYKRPDELQKVIEHLSTQPFIDEILVWDNSIAPNFMTYGRFMLAALARNQYVYTQDDDCIIENIQEIFGQFDGTRLVNGMKQERMRFYEGDHTLVGWGTFFDKAWLRCFDQYTEKYGFDSLLYREADRIFTSLLDVPRLTVNADVKDFPSAIGELSMSAQPEHEDTKSKALHRCEGIKYARK